MQSGFYRVDIDNNKLSNGFFAVRYRYPIDGKTSTISRTSLDELEKTILENDLPWKVIDQEKAARTRAFDQDFQKVKKGKQYAYNNEEVQKIRNEYQEKISPIHDEYQEKVSKVLKKHQDKNYQQRMALIRNFVNDMNDVNFYKK